MASESFNRMDDMADIALFMILTGKSRDITKREALVVLVKRGSVTASNLQAILDNPDTYSLHVQARALLQEVSEMDEGGA